MRNEARWFADGPKTRIRYVQIYYCTMRGIQMTNLCEDAQQAKMAANNYKLVGEPIEVKEVENKHGMWEFA